MLESLSPGICSSSLLRDLKSKTGSESYCFFEFEDDCFKVEDCKPVDSDSADRFFLARDCPDEEESFVDDVKELVDEVDDGIFIFQGLVESHEFE